MIRVIFCFIYVFGFSFYAWRNWFVSACASVVLMAVFQHPDMPKSLLGIQGLNPWNILFLNVTLAWLSQRTEKGCVWDVPRSVVWMMITFSIVTIWGFSRMALDPANLVGYSFVSGFSEYIINNLKWLLLAIIFYDSCRTTRNITIGLFSIVALYVVLSIQVIRWVPLSFAVAGGADFAHIAYKLIQNEIGYNRVTLSMVLGGASWGAIAFLGLAEKSIHKIILLGVFVAITLSQALTGGRTGYVSWAAVGFVMCAIRWRKMLLLIPVVVIAVLVFLPGVRDRMLFGVGNEGVEGETDAAKMTSGRTTIWPYVIEKIGDSPILGYGRTAMQRTGLTAWLMENLDEDNFGHPHNAYLEQLLDNGIVGALGILPLYFAMLRRSFRLFLDKQSPYYAAAGGMACALVLALMIGALGGQTFYPREAAAGMWAAIGIMLRLSVDQARWKAEGAQADYGDAMEPVMDDVNDPATVEDNPNFV